MNAANDSTVPRVSIADIEAEIRSERYFTAAEGVAAVEAGLGERSLDEALNYYIHRGHPLSFLTFCVLILRNGFTVTGESSFDCQGSFDAAIGRKIARAMAIDKIKRIYAEERAATPIEGQEPGGIVF